MSGAHATLSASGSAKWLACPAALALESLIDAHDSGSEFAREGTAAHEVLEKCLRDNKEANDFLNTYITILDEDEKGIAIEYEIKVTQDMVNAVEIALEYVRRLAPVNAWYEEKLDYSHIAPNGFGTGDVVLEVYEKIAPKKRANTLYVIDYKHGRGKKVDAFENTQGILYALGALETLEIFFERGIERITIVILQPRIDNIAEWTITPDELSAWADKIKPKAQKAWGLYEAAKKGESIFASANFNPTEKGCLWCQGKRLKRCKACAQSGYEAAVEGFSDLSGEEKADLPGIEVSDDTLVDPAFLDNADLAAIFNSMRFFLSFAEGLDEEIRRRINSGDVVPGLALKPAKKKREWSLDEPETIKALRTAGLQKKHYEKNRLVTPTEAEAELKKVKPSDYLSRYKKLEKTAIHRLPGNEKIVVDDSVDNGDFDDLLN